VLAGRYTVLNMLGEGGMGVVLNAYDMRLDRRVALKLLRPKEGSSARQDERETRLVREAHAMARLSHPNVVAVYDAGALEEGGLYIAMELVEGQTLQEWCSEQSRTWRDILRAYVAAGRGLAAAHAAGLVHRDFKPANVLVGKQGQVRVTDFGVARSEARTDMDSGLSRTPQQPMTSVWETPLTQQGKVVGTLRYMAPEVLDGRARDARSDLYAFCLALYEDLYRQAAFRGKTLSERYHSQLKGPREVPAQTAVPGWVTRAVLAGLRAEPEQRPASMEELLSWLENDPEVRRRARLKAGALVAGVLSLGVLAGMGWLRGQPPSCTEVAHLRLQGMWDEQLKGRVKKSFLDTGLAYAPATFERVSALLDGYVGAWEQRRAQACEASREQVRSPQRLAELEVDCLERQRSQVRALTELFAREPDPESLPKAVQAVQALPPLEYCADAKVLTAAVPLPEDPTVRARVAALQERVDGLQALHASGKYREGLGLAEPLLEEVQALEYAPLKARAAYTVAQLRESNSEYARAETLVRQALLLAAQGKDAVLMAQSWSLLLLLVGDRQERLEEARGLVLPLEMAVEHADNDLVRASSLTNQGSVLFRQGKYPEAREKHERALAIRIKALGPEHPDAASSLTNVANTFVMMGKYPEAQEKYERALAIRIKALGPDHPIVCNSLNNLGVVLKKMGRVPEAREKFERALAIRLKVFGPDNVEVANALNNLGVVLKDMGNYPEAREKFERALATRLKVLGPDHPGIADTLNNLGLTLQSQGNYPEAREKYERALAIRIKVSGPEHPEIVDVLNNMGSLLQGMGNYPEAQKTFERALAVGIKALGPEHPHVVMPLLNLANVQEEVGNYPQARQTFERVVAIWSKALGPEHPDVALGLSGLGRVQTHLGQLDTASALLKQALALLEKKGLTHPYLADPLVGQGQWLLARGQPAQAVVPLERALGLARPDARPLVQFDLAKALWDSGKDRPRAVDLATQARAFFLRIGHEPRAAMVSRWLSRHGRASP
jgi:serine/threonine-protein kinase